MILENLLNNMKKTLISEDLTEKIEAEKIGKSNEMMMLQKILIRIANLRETFWKTHEIFEYSR